MQNLTNLVNLIYMEGKFIDLFDLVSLRLLPNSVYACQGVRVPIFSIEKFKSITVGRESLKNLMETISKLLNLYPQQFLILTWRNFSGIISNLMMFRMLSATVPMAIRVPKMAKTAIIP